MQTYLLWTTVIMSLATFGIHTFMGSSRVAEPLLENRALPKASKWLNYYTWHITTIFTLYMGGGYAYVALYPHNIALLIFLTICTASFSILSAVVALKGKINPFYFPSTSLFAIVALLGLSSLFF